MQFLIFALTYPVIWILSRLPMRILYMISDVFFFLIYYVFGYRKEIVLENLQLAFPEKTEEERLKIRKKFFKHLMDLMMESVKAFSISEKEILKRYKYTNPELVNNFTKQGRNITLVGAHQANWEWSVTMPLALDITVYGAYMQLQNKYFEKKVYKSRKKFGIDGFKASETVKGIQKNFDKGLRGAYILLSDQSPQPHKTFYWRTFFGVKVPVHTGAEMLSKRFNLVVINYLVRKVKRGYYEIDFQLITDSPKDFENYQITDKYTELTENNIKQQPAFYLWSHRRFKHRDKVPKEFL